MKNIKKLSANTLFQVAAFVILFCVVSLALDVWRGQHIPKYTLPTTPLVTLNTDTINIDSLSDNQLVVVYFWATWCGPCKVTTPSVKQLAKHYPVVSIAMASGDNATLARFAHNAQITFPVINDNAQTLARSWGVKVTPSVLFIKNSKVLGFTAGVSGYPGLLARSWWLENL